MSQSNPERVDDVFQFGNKLWNYSEASEPVTKGKEHSGGEMSPSRLSIHRYLIVAFAVAVGITLLFTTRTVSEILCAIFLGWLLGQLFRWEPPH